MWPLYEEPERGSDAEELGTRWRGGAGRAYFNEFKDCWSRTHEASLRKLPSIELHEYGAVEGVGARFHKQAVAVLDAAVSAATHALHEVACDNDGDVSLQVRGNLQQIKPPLWSTCEDRERDDSVQQKERGIVNSVHRQDTMVLDRQDRSKERRCLSQLQAQLRSLIKARLQDPPALPMCPNIWSDNHDLQRDNQRQHSPRMTVQDSTFLQPKNAGTQFPRTVETTCQSHRSTFDNPARSLTSHAKQMLDSMTATQLPCTLNTVISEATSTPNFDWMRPKGVEEVGRVPAIDTYVTPRTSSTIIDAIQVKDTSAPKRVIFEGLFRRRTSQPPILAVASSIFKMVAKKNASLILGCTVPDILTSAVSELLRRPRLASMGNRQFDICSTGGIRLVPLPSDIVKDDEARVEGSHNTLQLDAHGLGKALPSSPISLTSLSLTLPSVWRHTYTLDLIEDFKARVWVLPNEPAICPQEATSVFREPVTLVNAGTVATSGVDGEETKPGDERIIAAIQGCGHEPTEDKATQLSQALPCKTLNTVKFTVQDNASTDDLVASFLHIDLLNEDSICESSPNRPGCPSLTTTTASLEPKFALTIDQLARPAVWFLVRLKMMKANSSSMLEVLKSTHLEVFRALAFQLQSKLKEVSANPSKMQAEDIVETCAAFRHVIWLHILRMIVECHGDSQITTLTITSRLLGSTSYQAAIGTRQTVSLTNFLVTMGGSPENTRIQHDCHKNTAAMEPPLKKPRTSVLQPEKMPVRVACDERLLERDELLEAMSDLEISVVERELSPPIDIIIDERNAIVLLAQRHFDDEQLMRAMTYELASSQVQFEKIWIIIDDVKSENALHFFYAALASFAINVQTFVCRGEAEVGDVLRGIIDACAESALSQQKILPKMWFARPFMLDEESQLERFLSSTRIMSGFAAQSILHRLSIEDLTTKSMEEVTSLVGGSLPNDQVQLLWRLLHNHFGIGNGEYIRD